MQNESSRQILKTGYLFRFMAFGVKRIASSAKLRVCALIYIALLTAAVFAANSYFSGVMAVAFSHIYTAAIVVVGLLLGAFLALIAGLPKGFLPIQRNMSRVGGKMRNALGECPVLISRKPKNEKTEVWEFESYGIPLSAWVEEQPEIESALGIAIIRVDEGTDGRKALLTLIPYAVPWEKVVEWNDGCLPEKESAVALGNNRCEQVIADLSVIPHFFVVSRTGGGKSIMLLSLIYQLYCKAAKIYVVDFKGGIDYTKSFRKTCSIVTDHESLLSLMTELLKEMKARISLLYDTGCHNIDEYNEAHPEDKKQRIVLVVDEAAEALSPTSSEQKKTIAAIEMSLVTLSRLARATNINIIMAAQRGGSEIINPSLRVNLVPIIGACDSALSIMVTGSADASKLIPMNTPGRFMFNNEMFQGYYSDFESLLALKEGEKSGSADEA